MKLSSLSLFLYGKHYPQGLQGFNYITSENGTWRALNPAQYVWNYYENPAPVPENHPFNKSALISYSDGTQLTTCRDANGHLLLDFNHDGELDTTEGKFAYFEHAGRGVNNVKMGNPFSNFWFDDNSLAMNMNLAYDTPVPYGLSTYSEFTRWQIMTGDNANWTPYGNPNGYIDQLALNGLYYLSKLEFSDPKLEFPNQKVDFHSKKSDFDKAIDCWEQIVNISKYSYNSNIQQYSYPGVLENYYYGLWLTLTSFLINTLRNNIDIKSDNVSEQTLLQHFVSIRSNILLNQVRDESSTFEGPFYGWISNIASENQNNTSLMNTESIACCVIGLGAGALHTYEASHNANKNLNYFKREYNVLSAVTFENTAGDMLQGPYASLRTGKYEIEFILRLPSNTLNENVVRLEVINTSSNTTLVTLEVKGSDFVSDNLWVSKTLQFELLSDVQNALIYRVFWYGNVNVDLSVVRVRREV